MKGFRPIQQKRLSLLVATLLLLSNALVTAHAFGEVDHAVKDGCQILHQFERQQGTPTATVIQEPGNGRYAAPLIEGRSCTPVTVTRHFQPRAPPFA
ncbi:MAG TPA: hypothetical protein VF267_07130 [Gammaproteobacteria bacterium]